jgi:hypothetical protein
MSCSSPLEFRFTGVVDQTIMIVRPKKKSIEITLLQRRDDTSK